jgi:hypothetical protein
MHGWLFRDEQVSTRQAREAALVGASQFYRYSLITVNLVNLNGIAKITGSGQPASVEVRVLRCCRWQHFAARAEPFRLA